MIGDGEAKLMALACHKPPDGYEKWIVRPLADKLFELEIVEPISYVTVQRAFKNEIRPRLKRVWYIPKAQDTAFVTNMKDILEICSREYAEKKLAD